MADNLTERFQESAVCPECRDGKHRNCDGSAWSNLIDAEVGCACWGGQVGNHGTTKGMQQVERQLSMLDPESPVHGKGQP